MKVKQVRGQLRQIAKELLPEVLASELFAVLHKEQEARLAEISRHVSEALKQMDERQRTVQNMIMREMTRNVPANTSEITEEPSNG